MNNYDKYKKYKAKYKAGFSNQKAGFSNQIISKTINYQENIRLFFEFLESNPKIYHKYYKVLNLPKNYLDLQDYLLSFKFTQLDITPDALEFTDSVIQKIDYDKNMERIDIGSKKYIDYLSGYFTKEVDNYYLTGGASNNDVRICNYFLAFFLLIILIFVSYMYEIDITDPKYRSFSNFRNLQWVISTILITHLRPICTEYYNKIQLHLHPPPPPRIGHCIGVQGCESHQSEARCRSGSNCSWVDFNSDLDIEAQDEYERTSTIPLAEPVHLPPLAERVAEAVHAPPPKKKSILRRAARKITKRAIRKFRK